MALDEALADAHAFAGGHCLYPPLEGEGRRVRLAWRGGVG